MPALCPQHGHCLVTTKPLNLDEVKDKDVAREQLKWYQTFQPQKRLRYQCRSVASPEAEIECHVLQRLTPDVEEVEVPEDIVVRKHSSVVMIPRPFGSMKSRLRIMCG